MDHNFKKEHEGRRMLIRKRYGSVLYEVALKELSPSMEHMKVQWISGSYTWEDCEDYDIVEILGCPPVQFHGIPGGA